MKKFFLIMVAVIGFGVVANADGPMCQITSGVQPSISSPNGQSAYVKVTNTNDYKVNVVYVLTYKGEVVSSQQIAILDAKKSSGSWVSHWAGSIDGFNANYLSVNLAVSTCQ